MSNDTSTPGKLAPDLHQAARFLLLLDEEAERFCFQTFDDSPTKRRELAHTLHGALDDLAPRLAELNRAGAGVFITVNEIAPGKPRTKKNAVRVRAVFEDQDKAGAGLPSYPLEPHIRVESSPGKRHAYWLVDGLPLEQFAGVQKAIAAFCKSDKSVSDTSRVMRLPGFWHMKDPGRPYQVRIVAAEEALQPYPAARVLEAFPVAEAAPATAPTPGDHAAEPHLAAARKIAFDAARRTHDDAALSRHGEIVRMGHFLRRDGIPLTRAVGELVLDTFAAHMRPTNAAGEPASMDRESAAKALREAYRTPSEPDRPRPAPAPHGPPPDTLTGTEGNVVYMEEAKARKSTGRKPIGPNPYSIQDGRHVFHKPTADGELIIPLCNFAAHICRQITFDDGARQENRFQIEGKRCDGRELPAVEVPANKFQSMAWVTDAWGVSAVVAAGQSTKDRLREAILLGSEDAACETIHGHTGWRKINDEWFFLHAGGALGRKGQDETIKVQLQGRMALYQLPAPPGRAGLRDAVRSSLALSRLSDNLQLGFLLLALVYRAPLADAYAVDHGAFKAGRTGAGKSEAVALALAHFGAGFNARSFPANWEDSETDMEMKSHSAKDVLLVVDDFRPHGTQNDIRRLHAKADRLFRGAGNQSGRGRRDGDLSAKTLYYPRGLVVATGEDIPTGHSLRGRMAIYELRPGEIDTGVLTDLQEAARSGALASAMAGYVQWLAARMDKVRRHVPEQVRAHRATLRLAHARGADIYGSLMTGLSWLLDYAEAVHALGTEGKAAMLADGSRALMELMTGQTDFLQDQDETEVFLDLLKGAFISGKGHLVSAERQGPPFRLPHAWGWRSDGHDERGEQLWAPVGVKLGWLDETAGELLLEQQTVFEVVSEFARRQGRGIEVTQRTLWKRLKEKGLLTSDGDRGRFATKRQIAGVRYRVVVLPVKSLDPL